ncbi:MAG TPA: GNAT family N-acetyltransferase [Fimbriimonas sp.]|nr:GNAT family N-acetyltransferase [Fimbriimonas sp.]
MESSFETERLIARRWVASDLDDLAEMYGDMRVMRFLGPVPKIYSRDEVVEILERRLTKQVDWLPSRGSWAVLEKETGKFLGVTLAQEFPEGMGAPEVEVGYHFAFPAWGNGYATEICRATIRHIFELEPDFKTLYAVAFTENTPSLNVLRKSGMEFIGETTRFYNETLSTFVLSRDQLS